MKLKKVKLKICYLADWKSIHTQRWLKYFVNNGHDIHLISNEPQECFELSGITLHNFLFQKIETLKTKKGCYKLYLTLRLLKLKSLIKQHISL